MERQNSQEKIKGYCSQCSCWCPTISIVEDGIFVEVREDGDHPLHCGLCPKGLAGPEMVYSHQRLRYPIRRTNPKGAPDPGWERISWEDALDTIAARLKEIQSKYGPESIAVARSGPAGSAMGELGLWVTRFANALGTPNNIATTHICQWHRDCGSSYTYGNIGGMHSEGRAEFERSNCILMWGNNTHATRHSLLRYIKKGLDRGAKLIVVDPRRTEIAAMADLWLQIRPGADGALALGMINKAIEDKLYDQEFVRDWTTAPFFVRSDTGDFLRPGDLEEEGGFSDYVVMGAADGRTAYCSPGRPVKVLPVIDGGHNFRLRDRRTVGCKTVFRLLREAAAPYTPEMTETMTGIPRHKILEASDMFFNIKPASWYSWNGIEQSINATQTNRAICILYALTGNFDTPGGNVILRGPASNPILGHDLLSPEVDRKRLGSAERPLGPGGTFKSTQAYEIYHAVLTGKPYPIRGMVGFGGNLIMSNAPSLLAREAISRLEFHVQTELFLSPTAELADIVLPAASSWECWHVGSNIGPLGDKGYIQLRPAVVPPQHESWPDMKIMFELAKRLGLGDLFWDGDIEAGVNHQFAPSNVTVEQLRMNSGLMEIDLPVAYRKYSKKDESGNFSGLPTPSKRIEIYSTIFKDHGYDPLPAWRDPASSCFSDKDISEKYPLRLINSKVVEYSHSQHRALPSLRKRIPHPFLEINPEKADELGIRDGERVILETPWGKISLQAKLTQSIAPGVVCTQNGWWQECDALKLNGCDPYSQEGANVNLLYRTEDKDPISGSLFIKGHPCNVFKA
ncbi:MAG: molybdopterin-containing oxidoreductase family protein [Desulfatiglandales bacterium]